MIRCLWLYSYRRIIATKCGGENYSFFETSTLILAIITYVYVAAAILGQAKGMFEASPDCAGTKIAAVTCVQSYHR